MLHGIEARSGLYHCRVTYGSEERGSVVYDVYINYVSGERIGFKAQEFNLDVQSPNRANRPVKFTYKDVNGEDAPIYLTLNQIEGIAVIPEDRTN